MRKWLFAGAVVLGLVGLAAVAQGDQAKTPRRQYRVECRLVEYDAEGKKRNVGTGSTVLREDSPGIVSMGQEMAIAGEDNKAELLQIGSSIRILVRGQPGGKVHLDATAEYSWLEPSPKSKMRVRSVGSRAIETVRLGEAFRVEMESGSDDAPGRAFEVTVQEADNGAK